MLIDLATKYDRFKRFLSFEISFFKKLTKQLKISLQVESFRVSKDRKVINNSHKEHCTLIKAVVVAATVLPTSFFRDNVAFFKAGQRELSHFDAVRKYATLFYVNKQQTEKS